jgi:aconitate decarboxylase
MLFLRDIIKLGGTYPFSDTCWGGYICLGRWCLGWATDGRHVTGTTGSFGAAAAVSKLLNLSPEQFYMALGHASSLAGGTRVANGTDTKTLHMGRGAQNGLLAALLAQQDFGTGSEPVGYWGNLVSDTVDLRELNSGLGEKWELLENTFKPYPCGIVIHPLIDGCISLHKRGIKVTEVERLEVLVNPQCTRLCFIRHPSTALEGVFSLYHGCAVGLLYGEGGRNVFSDEACNRPEVSCIRDIISVSTDKTVRDDEAYVAAIMKSGERIQEHVEHAVGSLARPMNREGLERKFVDQSEGVLGRERCVRIMQACWRIEEMEDISELLALCRKE